MLCVFVCVCVCVCVCVYVTECVRVHMYMYLSASEYALEFHRLTCETGGGPGEHLIFNQSGCNQLSTQLVYLLSNRDHTL